MGRWPRSPPRPRRPHRQRDRRRLRCGAGPDARDARPARRRRAPRPSASGAACSGRSCGRDRTRSRRSSGRRRRSATRAWAISASTSASVTSVPSDLGDLREDEQGLDPALGARPELGVEVGLGLVRRLEIGRLGDPLPGERRAELVVHHLDLLVDEDVRQLQGGVGDGVLDDPVGEPVAGPVERAPLEAARGSPGGGRPSSAKSPIDRANSSSASGMTFSRSSLSSTAKWADGAGEVRLAVVGREVDVELGRVADREADDVVLEAGDEPVLAQDERHPLGRAALERDAVAGPDETDDRVVALLGRTLPGGPERGVLVAQLVDDRRHLGVVDRLDLRREVEVAVVAEGHLRRDLDERREPERLALLGLDHLDAGLDQGHDPPLHEHLAIGLLDEQVARLVEDGLRPEDPLEHEPGRLAGPEPGDLGASGEPPDGLVDRPIEILGRELDLELDR